MSKCTKATPEELFQLMRHSSTGAGQSIVLNCRHCRDVGSISADKRTISSEDHMLKAAEKFASQGWRIEAAVAVCPGCFIRRVGKGKYGQEEID